MRLFGIISIAFLSLVLAFQGWFVIEQRRELRDLRNQQLHQGLDIMQLRLDAAKNTVLQNTYLFKETP
jgi:hypothetical protein